MAGQAFTSEATFLKALPIMASAVIALVIGGVIGTGYLGALAGGEIGPLARLSSLFTAHWFLMILGFTNALIAAELLTLLSMEWSRRVAPAWVRMAFLAFYWASIILYASGMHEPGLLAAAAGLLIVGAYSFKVLTGRSWIGLPPSHYNYLLTATPFITLAVILAWLALGGFSLPMALTLLPVAAIIAVESRDIPLLLGIPPSRNFMAKSRSLRARAVAGYAVSTVAILLLAYGMYALGGVLLAVGGVLAFMSVSLLKAVEKASKAIPVEVKKHVTAHVALSYAWFVLAGFVALAYGTGLVEGWRIDSIVVHMLTLGFMFNVIMGIDAILLYGHAGISLSETPKPTPWPGLVLNAGIIARVLFDAGLAGGVAALLSAVLTGLGILLFYVRNMSNILRIILARRRG